MNDGLRKGTFAKELAGDLPQTPISALDEVTEVSEEGVLPFVQGNTTYKVKYKTIKNDIVDYVDTELIAPLKDIIYTWDTSVDGYEIDCSSIDAQYNTINIKGATSAIHTTNLVGSKIKKITVSAPETLQTIDKDIGVDGDTYIAIDYINVYDISGTIYFYTGDTNSEEVFKERKFIASKSINFSGTDAIYTYNLNGLAFSIEFNNDYTKILSYFGVDDFVIPFRYTASTSTLTKNNNVFYRAYQNYLDPTNGISNEDTCMVYKDGTGTNDSQYKIVTINNYLFENRFHSGMLLIPHGDYVDIMGLTGTLYAKSVQYVSGTNALGNDANEIFVSSEKMIATDDRIIQTKYNPVIATSKAKKWINSFICSKKIIGVEGGDATKTVQFVCNGQFTKASSVTSGWAMDERKDYYSDAGCYSNSNITHAISSFTYWEKGENEADTYLSDTYKETTKKSEISSNGVYIENS